MSGERSIAELIGCARCKGLGYCGEPSPDCQNCQGRGCMDCVFRVYDHECADDCPSCCQCPECFGVVPDVTVDGLLGWLLSQGYRLTDAFCVPLPSLTMLVRFRHPSHGLTDVFRCPSLLAALESAVRAVAADGET